MNEIKIYTDYGEFDHDLKTLLSKQAEMFVYTGWMLYQAETTKILTNSGYSTLAEYAKAELNLEKDVVSRYIGIYKRYSEGNAPILKEEYREYGYAKLAEMLTLPDLLVEAIPPEMTRREIQEIKKEIKEENKISPLEVMMEGEKEQQEPLTKPQKALHQYFYDNRNDFVKLKMVIEGNLTDDKATEQLLDVLAPSGIGKKTVRVQGIGTMMLLFRGKNNTIVIIDTRANEKFELTWSALAYTMAELFGHAAGETEWEQIYGEPFKKKEPEKQVKPIASEPDQKVAPVQPAKESKEPEKVEKTQDNAVTKNTESTQQEKTAESNFANEAFETENETLNSQNETLEDVIETVEGTVESVEQNHSYKNMLLNELKIRLRNIYRCAEKQTWFSLEVAQEKMGETIARLKELPEEED